MLTPANLFSLIDVDRLDIFCSQYLFDRVPYLFNDETQFYNWKSELSKRLEIDAHDIVIVGSAAVGFSLNPTKDLRVFNSTSDIDVAILSQRHFDIAWRHLRNLGSRAFRMLPEEQEAVKSHRRNYIY